MQVCLYWEETSPSPHSRSCTGDTWQEWLYTPVPNSNVQMRAEAIHLFNTQFIIKAIFRQQCRRDLNILQTDYARTHLIWLTVLRRNTGAFLMWKILNMPENMFQNRLYPAFKEPACRMSKLRLNRRTFSTCDMFSSLYLLVQFSMQIGFSHNTQI